MRLFWRYQFRQVPKETTGESFRKVLTVLRDSGMSSIPIRFCFRGDTGLKRVVKRYPETAGFAFHTTDPQGDPAEVMCNLDGRWQESNPNGNTSFLNVDTLTAIADGVPKSFGLSHANVIFEAVPWLLGSFQGYQLTDLGNRRWSGILPSINSTSRDFPLPGIVLESSWWTPRRRIQLSAVVHVDAPDASTAVCPRPDDQTLHYLNGLGKIQNSQLLVDSDPSERALLESAGAKAQQIREEWNSGLPSALRGLSIPHALPETVIPIGAGLTSPHKDALVSVFQPRGFRYQSSHSGPGLFLLMKPSPGNNRLYLQVDVGTWSHSFSGMLTISGPGWNCSFTVMVSPDQKRDQYAIGDQEHWVRIVDNAAAVVHHLENNLVPRIEELYPHTPAWFINDPSEKKRPTRRCS